MFVSFLALAGCASKVGSQSNGDTGVTVFQGARLITGDGSAPIESSAFIVQNDKFTLVGRQGEVQIPAGAARVDLTGKTVMPAMVDLHGHIGYQNVPQGTMSKETYTRENLIDHLQRLAYNGVGAVVSIADLVDRSDLHGGRTGWGDVPLRVREEVIPNAALFRTAGTGIAWPGSGPQGHPSRSDVPYAVATPDEARAAVDDYVKMKPEFIKIWVDDRGGTKPKLTPPVYRAIIEEAHKFNVPVAAHNVTLADAKELMRAGVEGWLHVPVRGKDEVDDELIAIVKDRIAKGNRPNIWMTPALAEPWGSTNGGQRPAWLDDPLLHDTYSAQQIEEYWGDPLKNMKPADIDRAHKIFALLSRNAMKLRAAGVRVVMGTDTGQTRFFIGYSTHMDLEGLVAMGMTPSEVIVAATSDAARVAHLDNMGLVAAGKSADFIVLDANPLDSISNTRRIDQVYLRGQQVPRAALKAKWQAEFHHTTSTQ